MNKVVEVDNKDIKKRELDGWESVDVYGARVHNLKNIDATFPHNSLCVVTGLSGSGKSSLAFDTIFAEGQRRYIETFSSYARNMMGSPERPDVDKITGLSPVISIEQKTINKNPRSTIGTVTEIYDFFRLLYARLGEARSYVSGKPMVKYTSTQIVSLIEKEYDDKKVYVMTPLVKNRKGHHKELFEKLRKKGYLNVRVDGEILPITYGMRLDRYKNHSVELVVDRLRVNKSSHERLRESVENALKQGQKLMMICDAETGVAKYYSQLLMDAENGISYPEPAPHNFSFNSPQGACARCKGLGYVSILDRDKIMPDMKKSISQGGIAPLGKAKNSLIFWQIDAVCHRHDFTLETPLEQMTEECINEILYGCVGTIKIHNGNSGLNRVGVTYDGIAKYIEMQLDEDSGAAANKWGGQFFSPSVCPECNGRRLNKIALNFFINGKSISDVCEMDIAQLYEWTDSLEDKVDPRKKEVAVEILKEIRTRLRFLIDVGLEYLSLNRGSATLSGGESQRIRLATQIGSQLVNVLYILDEPSIGLHQRDNHRLIKSLKQLRDNGNSIIVVEHDKDIMLASDWIVDIGPGAGVNGGEVVFQGEPSDLKNSRTLTSDYIFGKREISIPESRRPGNGKEIVIEGATGNNLKNVDLHLPLGKFVCVTGVSGSGKSSLINGTLHPIISKKLYRSQQDPLPYKRITGDENIDKIVTVDQSPLGRTPRSNPATYTGVFTDIRKLFVGLPDAKMRGYKPGRFSFNVAGGRCEVCKGHGYRTIEMNFLPDVLVPCEECHGKRYNRETLEVRYKGKSIADVLDMTVDQAVEFFSSQPVILRKIQVLQDIGLGYLRLGQPSSTLSGGENQRVKLATELAKKDTGKTLFILDEPTTGLHFEDIRVLMKVINRLVDKGNTMVVIEHNLDVIKCADYIIDMGPESGRGGGMIIAQGTPEEIVRCDTPTALYLRQEMHCSPS